MRHTRWWITRHRVSIWRCILYKARDMRYPYTESSTRYHSGFLLSPWEFEEAMNDTEKSWSMERGFGWWITRLGFEKEQYRSSEFCGGFPFFYFVVWKHAEPMKWRRLCRPPTRRASKPSGSIITRLTFRTDGERVIIRWMTIIAIVLFSISSLIGIPSLIFSFKKKVYNFKLSDICKKYILAQKSVPLVLG